jgi:signal transduction histidine kinase
MPPEGGFFLHIRTGGCMNKKNENKNLTTSLLKNIYFFNSMPDHALEKIVALGVEKNYEQGSILFFEDMPGDCFFVILEGELEIWKRYGQEDEILLGISGVGQPIGEMALIDERPRSATIRAKTPVVVFVIDAIDFNNLLLTENSICMNLLRAVTLMVRRSNEAHIADLDRQNKELARAYSDLQSAQEELLNRERLSVVGRFSSLILHDIRNPLSALRSRVELLRINHQNEEYFDESIVKINNDISRMEILAAEFLDYARGDIRLQMTICNLQDLCARFREAILLKTENNGITLCIENLVQKPVIIDEDRLLRVLINAGENACKAMPSGGTLSLALRRDTENLIIEIVDTGAGMSPDVLEHVFEPFYSAASPGGTGLGMIIIKSIIDAHRGTVRLTSREGVGTRMIITIPALM